MNPFLKTLGQYGNAAENAIAAVGTPIAKATVMPAVDITSNILGNMARDFAPPKVRQLPPNIQSPIPQEQIVPHQTASSWLGMGLNAAGNAIGTQMGRLLPLPGVQQSPIPSATPHPMQPVVNHLQQRFAPQPTMGPIVNNISPNMPGLKVLSVPNTPTPTEAPPPTGVPIRPTQAPQVLGNNTGNSGFEQQTLPIFQQHGVNPAVAYGIAAAEGGRIGQHNIWNINATDSNPQGATNYGSVQQAAQGAAQLIQRMLQARGVTSSDPNVQLQAIEQSGYAGDPRTWQARSAATGGAGRQFRSWSDFVRSTPAWNKWIVQH